MNKKGTFFKALGFLGLMAAVYLEFCAMRAFFRVSWEGFGDPGMEYTPSGMVIGYIIVYVPVSLLLLILVLRMIMHYRRKAAIKYYFYDILFCVTAVGAGFLAFYFLKEPGETIVRLIIRVIRECGWVKYPVP